MSVSRLRPAVLARGRSPASENPQLHGVERWRKIQAAAVTGSPAPV